MLAYRKSVAYRLFFSLRVFKGFPSLFIIRYHLALPLMNFIVCSLTSSRRVRFLFSSALLVSGGFLAALSGLHGQTQYTSGYQPHFRPEAPGTLIYRSPTPELGGRLTNLMYHQGWLMAGFENPGSNSRTNDLRFRVMDVSNLENDPVPVPYWPSDFGLDYGTNNRGLEHWYTGNWGYNTHAHGRTATHVHWPNIIAPDFGGAVYRANSPDEEEVGFAYGWGGFGGGRLRRHLPWNATQDWAYGNNTDPTIHLQKAWRVNPNGDWGPNNYRMHSVAWIPGAEFGVRGFSDLLGDKFIFTSDQRNTGVAVYQVPDDVLADNNASSPRMDLIGVTQEPFGGYWPELWASEDGRLYAVGVNNDIRVVDLTDLSNPRLIVVLNDNPSRNFRIRNAVYPKFQDDYMLIENIVIDMEQLIAGEPDPVVLELEAPPRQSGWREGFDPSQYTLPMGNLIVTGGYGETTGGMFIHVRQQEPDTTPPTVRYHIPEVGRTNYSRYMPISVIIHEELDSRTLYNGVNFMIREVVEGEPTGEPVDVIFNLGSNNVMMLTPKEPLKADTTYQVDFPNENGVMDISGNRIVEYSWRFSTGDDVQEAQPVPEILSLAPDTYKAAPGETFTLNVEVRDTGPFQYRVDYGDGNGFGSWQDLGAGTQQLALTRSYSEVGRYDVRFQVRDNFDVPATETLNLLVYNAPSGPSPTRSSPIIVAQDGRVWVVNPDANTVTVLENDGTKVAEYAVGLDPRGIAQDANGVFWVACMDSDEIYRLNNSGMVIDVLALDYGDAPFGVVPSPDGQTVYVSTYGSGALYQFDIANVRLPALVPLGHTARAIAVDREHEYVYVTRFISPRFHGEVWRVNAETLAVTTLEVTYDETIDNGNAGSGVGNYLNGIAISPDGKSAIVVGKKDNTFRGLLFDDNPLTHENTVRTTLAVLDLETGLEVVPARRDFDNSDSPTAAAFSPDGTMLFITVQGNNELKGIDSLDLQAAVETTESPILRSTGNSSLESPSGLAPQGLAIDPVTNRLFTHNFMSRSVTVFDMSEAFEENAFRIERVTEVDSVANELLSPEVLLGKQIFYNANDERMVAEIYMSCATCHDDGGHDGRTWDFTNRGEGLRNTTDLRGRSGMKHGNVHWSANFDEIHDFELDIVNHFLGTGFIENSDGPNPSLGAPNANRSANLDALAAYVASLDTSHLSRSPYREPDGSHTEAALMGAQVFVEMNCMECHRPDKEFTDSTLGLATLHNVGTLRDTSGNRLGGELPGIDTPTLLGLWDGAPYLHDGSADTLTEVFAAAGGTSYPAEDAILNGAILAIRGGSGHSYGLTAFGDYVLLNQPGQSVQFANVDGGPGGQGIVELRIYAASAEEVSLSVNGSSQTVDIPASPSTHGWATVRIEGVDLQAGTSNTLSLSPMAGATVALDQIVVGTAEHIAISEPHRKVLDLDTEDFSNLIAYLYELDQNLSGPELFPVPPAELAALAVDADQINLMFVDRSSLERGYTIEYREAGEDWQTLTIDPVAGIGNAVFREFTGLSQGVVYEFRVAASAGDVLTAWSETVTASPLVAASADPVTIAPLHDAYLDEGTGYNNAHIKLEEGLRVGYMMYDIPVFAQPLLEATLRFTVVDDSNTQGGTFRISTGAHTNWTETTLSSANAPAADIELADVDGNRARNTTYEVALSGLPTGLQSLVLEKVGGGDFWMSSKEGVSPPELILQYADGEVTPPAGPVITSHPQSTAIGAGDVLELTVAANGREELTYQWLRDGEALTNGTHVTGAFTSTLRITELNQAAGNYTVVVRDLAGVATSDVAAVTFQTELEAWRADSFPGLNSDDPLIANNADPDFDGIANLLEYLQSLDPMANQPTLRAQMVKADDEFSFQFRVRSDLTGVSYRVLSSTDMENWTPVAAEDIFEVSEVDGVKLLQVRGEQTPGTQTFYRIDVSQQQL